MTVDDLRLLGDARLPPLHGSDDELWQLVFELARTVEVSQWELIGGLMVVLHGLVVGRQPPRPTGDVDVLADIVASASALEACVKAVEKLNFVATQDSSGKVYRFVRPADAPGGELKVDILAPDHPPRSRSLRTRLNSETIKIEGGQQALERIGVVHVTSDDHGGATVPIPDLLGALVLKAAAWQADSRDRERHAEDAAFLASLITDPLAEADRLMGSDRKRLRALKRTLDNRDAREWRQLGPIAGDAHTAWKLLVGD